MTDQPKPKDNHEIDDNRIRVIVPRLRNPNADLAPLPESVPPPLPQKQRRKRKTWLRILLGGFLLVILLLVAYVIFAVLSYKSYSPYNGYRGHYNTAPAAPKSYVDIRDTVVGGFRLTLLEPKNASDVELHIGPDVLDDPDALLVAQAADIRADNDEINGAFVSKGRLVSRGEAKAGFCAIVNGKPVVGVADATPYFEMALVSEGDFFRQFPLVVGGQVVENKPKGEAYRKALAELNGETVVVMSDRKLTFHNFSQALADLGVTNAIYLVGGTSYGFARDAEGNRIEFGERVENPSPNANYIVWRP